MTYKQFLRRMSSVDRVVITVQSRFFKDTSIFSIYKEIDNIPSVSGYDDYDPDFKMLYYAIREIYPLMVFDQFLYAVLPELDVTYTDVVDKSGDKPTKYHIRSVSAKALYKALKARKLL